MYEIQQSPEAFFMKKHFSDYYSSHLVDSVPFVQNREFGFGVFKRKIANRNLAFSSVNEMNSFLRTEVPLFFSYSNSYYKFPSRTPMQSKEWLKSDIIYEFDADELGLDVPVLNNIQWFDSSHLNEAKKQVFRLLDFIENDFGFSSGEAKINFSGKAGFHVHLRSEKIQSLNKRARIQLVDYLTAQNIDLVNLGFNFDSVPVACPLHSGLWAKRINSGILNFFNKNPKEISKLTGVAQRKFAFLLSNRQKIVDNMASGVLPPIDSKKNNEFWRKIIDFVVSVQRVPIDRQTSIDLHKIIRVPETLHGETGFLAKSLSVDELKEFDAFKDAVVFSSSPQVKISIPSAPKFYLNNESFGPFNNSTEELPLFAALYLIGKGAAVLVEK